MKKYFITYCDFPPGNPKRDAYEKYTKPRFRQYCRLHDFEFVEISTNLAYPYNLGFAKVFWIKQNWDKFNPGDIITYMDIDCCIMDASVPAVFDKDFAIVRESCGIMCMGGTWSLRVSDWSKKFIDEMCSEQRQADNKDAHSWKTWHENDAIYQVLGLEWGDIVENLGTRGTSAFTHAEIKEHVQILPVEWGCTFHKDDVDFSKKKDPADRNDQDWIYYIVSGYARPEYAIDFDKIIVRHLSASTMTLNWANKYYQKDMKV
jgi:hypothetical protein